MTTDEQMRADHTRDQTDKRRMLDLSRAIHTFLADPPTRSSILTRDSLGRAREALETDCAHVVAVWD